MKKKIIIAISLILVVALVIAFPFVRYMIDFKDTEEAFRNNIATIDYENTIETAIPQTELYSIVKDHFTSELPEGKTAKKAIIIGYDGCRADILTEIEKEYSGIALLKEAGASFNLTYCGGVNYPEKNTQMTSTAPGWCSILTGQWADKHGITANDITKEVVPKTLLVSLCEENYIDGASFITRWAGHFDRKNATYLNEKEYCEKNSIPVSFNKCDDDEASFDFTLNEINKSDCADFIFVIYEPTDSVGHGRGFTHNNPKYKEAFKTADAYGLETIKAIQQRETYSEEDWLIIITSDHGGKGKDHGKESIQERMTFAVVL